MQDPDSQLGGHVAPSTKKAPGRTIEFGPEHAAAIIALVALGVIVVVGVGLKGARA